MSLKFPKNKTTVYFIIHESAFYPPELGFEYMNGNLRESLQSTKFGEILKKEAYLRLDSLAKKLKARGIKEIITDSFITPLTTAEYLAKQINNPNVITDSRIAESDLSYLSREKFNELEKQSKEDPFIFTRDWYLQASQEEKDLLYQGHVDIWNETIQRNDGVTHAYVLHVEGIQFFVNEFLGRSKDEMISLHFEKGGCVCVKFFSGKEKTLISFQ